jgi:hypothetical protein
MSASIFPYETPAEKAARKEKFRLARESEDYASRKLAAIQGDEKLTADIYAASPMFESEALTHRIAESTLVLAESWCQSINRELEIETLPEEWPLLSPILPPRCALPPLVFRRSVGRQTKIELNLCRASEFFVRKTGIYYRLDTRSWHSARSGTTHEKLDFRDVALAAADLVTLMVKNYNCVGEVSALRDRLLKAAQLISFTIGSSSEQNPVLPWVAHRIMAHEGDENSKVSKRHHLFSIELSRQFCKDENGDPSSSTLSAEINAAIRSVYSAAISARYIKYSKHLGFGRSQRGWLGLQFRDITSRYGEITPA